MLLFSKTGVPCRAIIRAGRKFGLQQSSRRSTTGVVTSIADQYSSDIHSCGARKRAGRACADLKSGPAGLRRPVGADGERVGPMVADARDGG